MISYKKILMIVMIIGSVGLSGCAQFDAPINNRQKEVEQERQRIFEDTVKVENVTQVYWISGSRMNSYIVRYTNGKDVWDAYYDKHKLVSVMKIGKVIYHEE